MTLSSLSRSLSSAVLVALILAGCAPALARVSRPTTAPSTAPAEAPGEAWYHLYFTNPTLTPNLAMPTGGVPDRIAAAFDAAQHTIDLAMYQFDLPLLAEALLRAQARGVRVRAVTDSDSLDMDGLRTLTQAGVPVVADNREPIMHDKFAVVDDAVVWTGSMNYTYSDAYRNDNNVLEIRSPELAQNYTHEFERMFVSRQFDAHSRADAPNPVVTLGAARIETYFAPSGQAAAHVGDVLAGATHSIYFMAFAFTRRDFGQALLDQAEAGLDVRGVFEGEQLAAGGNNVWKMLSDGGMAEDIKRDGNPNNMHNKVFVVDQTTVVTGSYNFSTAAEDLNDENVLIIHDPAIATAYFAQWERIWAQAR